MKSDPIVFRTHFAIQDGQHRLVPLPERYPVTILEITPEDATAPSVDNPTPPGNPRSR